MKARSVHDVQRAACVGIFYRFVHIYKLDTNAALVRVVVQHPAGKGENLRRNVDDRAVAQHRAGHTHAVHIGAVGRAEVVQLVVAVFVQNLAVVAGYAVADELDVAVIAAADEHPLLAADVHFPQDGVGGLFFYRGHAVALHVGDFFHAEGDFLRVGVAVGVQTDDIAALQDARLAGVQIAIVEPGAVVAAVVGDDPPAVLEGDGELVIAHTVAAQHVLALGAAAKAVAARRQCDTLFVAQFRN